MKTHLTQAKLKDVLEYDPLTGEFLWRQTLGGRFAGTKAGYQRPGSYLFIRIDGDLHRAHRLAWLYVHGKMPVGDLDHIDGDGGNNAISNLRIATRSQNNANKRREDKRNRSGFKGVSWNAACGRWQAHIKVNRKSKYLGLFDTPEEAHLAYCAAAKAAFGEFARAA